jgi:drug/metabolite transporter, DME family
MPQARVTLLGAAVVLAAATLFGVLGVASRWAYDAGVEPFAFVAWRAGSGAIGIAIVITALRGPARVLAELRGARGRAGRALLFAAVLSAGVNLSMFLAFDRTTVALALLGFYTYPAMVAAASVLLGRERLDLPRLVALGLALAGMVAVVAGGASTTTAARLDPFGIALGLLAGAFQTTYVLSSRRFASVPADLSVGVVLAGSSIAAGVVTVATAGPAALALPLRDPGVLVFLVAVGLFAAALPSTLFLTGIRWIGGVRAGILMLFEPVVGVALAAALLGEGLEPVQVLGGATILLAAILVQRGSGREASDLPADRAEPAVAPVPGGP